jgi:hypothetical protein
MLLLKIQWPQLSLLVKEALCLTDPDNALAERRIGGGSEGDAEDDHRMMASTTVFVIEPGFTAVGKAYLLQLFIRPKIRCYTLQRKSHLCIPFLGIARPQPQFPHSCVCERFI